MARGEEEVAGVRGENGRLRRSIRRLWVMAVLVLIAVAAGVGWSGWAVVARLVM